MRAKNRTLRNTIEKMKGRRFDAIDINSNLRNEMKGKSESKIRQYQ